MRIRTVKPEFHQHEGLAKLPREDRLLAVALLNWADDEGYFRSHPNLIAGALFPFDEDARAFVIRGIAHLAEAGFVRLFEGGIGQIAKFSEHQVINKPAKSRLATKALIPLPVEPTPVLLREDSRSPTVLLPEHSRREVEGEVEQGSGMEVESQKLPPPPPARPIPEDKFASPEAFFDWFQHKRREAGCVTERPPHPRKLSSWWSEVGMELGGEYGRLEAAAYRFAEDAHWQIKKPPVPFGALMSEWPKYVPQKRSA